jgi:hypothetical protein
MIKWIRDTIIGVQVRWWIHSYYRRPKDFGWTPDKPGKDVNRKPWGY